MITRTSALQGALRRKYREYSQEVQRSQRRAQGRALRGLERKRISVSGTLGMFSTFLRVPSLTFVFSLSQRCV